MLACTVAEKMTPLPKDLCTIDQLLTIVNQADTMHYWYLIAVITALIGVTAIGTPRINRLVRRGIMVAAVVCPFFLTFCVHNLAVQYYAIYEGLFGKGTNNALYIRWFTTTPLVTGVVSALAILYLWLLGKRVEQSQGEADA